MLLLRHRLCLDEDCHISPALATAVGCRRNDDSIICIEVKVLTYTKASHASEPGISSTSCVLMPIYFAFLSFAQPFRPPLEYTRNASRAMPTATPLSTEFARDYHLVFVGILQSESSCYGSLPLASVPVGCPLCDHISGYTWKRHRKAKSHHPITRKPEQ